MKSSIRRFLQKLGLDVRRWPLPGTRAFYLQKLAIQAVVDVGANEGGYAYQLREEGYQNWIWSFEPQPEVFKRLQQEVLSDPRWEAQELGLGATSGQQTMHVADSSLFSSLLNVEEWVREYTKDSSANRVATIQIKTLDELWDASEWSGRKLWLKADTQGYELPVLQGAEEHLSQIVAVELELPIKPLYHGQARLMEVIEWLGSRGFAFRDIFECNRNLNSGEIIEMNSFFINQRFLTDLE